MWLSKLEPGDLAEGDYIRSNGVISQGSVSWRICRGMKSVLHTIREQDWGVLGSIVKVIERAI